MAIFYFRIHYPLPLSYLGKPDPVQLQETIRKLTEENQDMKEQVVCAGTWLVVQVTIE